MLECNHLGLDKTESSNDSEQCGFVSKRPRWLKEKSNNFVQNTDKEKLQNIENILTYYLDADPQFITQSAIDNIVDNLTSVLLDSAERTNPARSNSEYKQ